MISDLDGQQLRAYADANGGQATIRVTSDIEEIQTDRAGVITSFSSAGPTDFGHILKPDISAPGLDVLSSTPPATTGETFSVFAGTSMATPHVAGAAALLLQQHPGWTPWEIKSALMSTAGPAWGDTARTQEAPVLLEGAGLTNVLTADDPKVFTDPQSLSFQKIDVSTGAQRSSMLLTVSDSGDGGGDWTVSLAPQSQTSGVEIDVPGLVTLAPGGDVAVPVVVRAAADAGIGRELRLRRPVAERRAAPGALWLPDRAAGAPQPDRGTAAEAPDRRHRDRARARSPSYCCPLAPFGPPPTYTGPTMNEDGSEHLYYHDVTEPIVNLGVSVLATGARGADRSIRARLEGRERRAGLCRDPDGRELAHLRRERRHRSGRRAVPPPAALLRRRRLSRRSLHEPLAEGQVPAERLGERPDPAVRAHPLDDE